MRLLKKSILKSRMRNMVHSHIDLYTGDISLGVETQFENECFTRFSKEAILFELSHIECNVTLSSRYTFNRVTVTRSCAAFHWTYD